MQDEIDKLLSEAFSKEKLPDVQAEFTSGVMKNLPRHGIPIVTRVAVLAFFAAIAIAVPLFNTGYQELYAYTEEAIFEGTIVLQYYMEQLVYIV